MTVKKEPKLEDQYGFGYFLDGLKTLWELLGKEQKKVGLVLAWMILLGVLDLAFPYLLKRLFDVLPEIIETGVITKGIWILLFSMLALRIVNLFLKRFGQEMTFLKSLIKLENLWPAQAQKKLLELSLGYHERENTGKKVSKISKGCDQLVQLLDILYWRFLPEVLYLVLNVIFVMAIDWRLGVLFVLPFAPAAFIILHAIKKNAVIWEDWEKGREVSTGMLVQSITNIPTVKSYVQEKREQQSMGKVREKMRQIDLIASKRFQKYYFVATTILNLFFIATIVLSIHFLLNGQGTLGTVIFIITTGNVTFQSLGYIVHEYSEISRKFIAVNRMKALLDEKPEIKNHPQAETPEKFSGNFEFKDVVFKYKGKNQPVLNKISFKIPANKMIALVGRTGEGKTTVFKLLTRMYDVNEGVIKLDGKDIRKLDLDWFRRVFAIVPQEVDIFDASLKKNIAYGVPGAKLEQIKQAVRAAHLGVILKDKKRFPNGLNTQVGERGVKLSGGEKQRVGIARAYLSLTRDAKILMLDEATSHLDSEAERAIQNMVDELREKKDISMIVVAHRLSTIKKSDLIYVINNGQIEEEGDHQELVTQGGVYAKLVELQQIGEVEDNG